MRITKKYAGASCLGKRVYHLCDRAPATASDVEVAKAELAHLEQRFRMRVEHGQTGLPLPPRNDLLPGVANGIAAAAQLPGLLQTLASVNAVGGAFPLMQPAAAGAQAGAFNAAALQLLTNPNALVPGAIPGLPLMP